MSDKERKDFREKIVKGLTLAFQRLVEQTKKENGELVFSQNGKIVHIKACDLN